MIIAVFDSSTPSHDIDNSSAKRPQDVIQGVSVRHRSPSISADRNGSGSADRVPVCCCLSSVKDKIILNTSFPVNVKSKFIKRHKNYTISTGTEALATLRLAT